MELGFSRASSDLFLFASHAPSLLFLPESIFHGQVCAPPNNNILPFLCLLPALKQSYLKKKENSQEIKLRANKNSFLYDSEVTGGEKWFFSNIQ